MKKHLLFIFFSVCCMFLFGQEKKEFPGESSKFTAGVWESYYQFGMRMSDPVSLYIIIKVADKNDATELQFEYSFGRRFSLGISYERFGLFIKPQAENQTFYDKISLNNLTLSPKIKFINRRNTIIYFELSPVGSLLAFQKSGLGSEYEFRSRGIGLQLGFGWQQFFGKHFGISLQALGSRYIYETEKMYDIQYPGDPQPTSMGYLNPQIYRYGIGTGLLIRF